MTVGLLSFGHPGFTPAWQPMLLGDGGQAKGIHVFPSGDIVTFTDTSNAYLYVPSGSITMGGRTIAAPAWQPLFTTSSVDPSLWTSVANTDNIGSLGLTQCASNPNVFYAIWSGSVYVTSDRGASWLKSNSIPDLPNANQTPGNSNYIACDPNNPDIAYVQTQGSGLYGTTTGRAGTGWAHVTAVAGATLVENGFFAGGNIVFDPTSSVVGGVTQHFWVSSNGIGVYETTNGGGNLALTVSTSPTRVAVMEADKFGQLWTAGGYNASGNDVLSLYPSAGGTWSTKLTSGAGFGSFFTGIVFDPNTGAVKANNHVIVITGDGPLTASLDNGDHWGAGGVANAYTTITTASSAPQAPWLGTAYQNIPIGLTTVNAGMDASGTIWIGGGISIWTTPNPISGSTIAGTTTWNANSVGIEQLVVNQVLASPGNYPITTVWDRGVLANPNPDALATVQFPQIHSAAPIQHGWGVDYAPNKTNVLAATITDHPGVSLDGGNSWSDWGTVPTGQSATGSIAVSTDQNWCAVPGQGAGVAGVTSIYHTANGGGTWAQSTVPVVTFTGVFGATATSAVGSGTNLTISGVTGLIFTDTTTGFPGSGDVITGTGIPANTTLVSQTSGTVGGAGVYVTSNATTINGAATITSNFCNVTSAPNFIDIRAFITGTGISENIFFTGFQTGTRGSTGVYQANGSRLQLSSRTFTATPVFAQLNVNVTGYMHLAANKVTAGIFYAMDFGNSIYKSTDAGATFTRVSTSIKDTENSFGKIMSVPGHDGHVWLVGSGGNHLYKSTDDGSTWTAPDTTMTNIIGFGFGAPKPGNSYPTIYLKGEVFGDPATYGYYYSTDAGVTYNRINAPSSAFNFALGLFDTPHSITGDMNVYGRLYNGYAGSGNCYIDMADACPYVNFDPASIKPGATGVTGTVTLTAQHSGLVPVSSVQFSVDGVNIGTAQTGQSTYSVSWNTGGVATGAHTLTVTATGANGSGSFSIPITTS